MVKNVDGQNIERNNAEWDKMLNGKKRRLGKKVKDKKQKTLTGQNIEK